MARYTITPWRTQSDLLSVRQNLYQLNTDNVDLRRHSVNRVMAWKVRGNLPHAVESTALLVDAILHHDLAHNSIFSIRAVYSAAFTRFVTGFCDIGRNRERALEPSSMLEIARQIDMPSEFVELRHEATHEDLPSVQRLVMVCGQALEWLWRVYWSRLEEPQTELTTETALNELKEESRKIFKEYRSTMRKTLKQKSSSSLERAELVQKTSAACAALCGDTEAAVVAMAGTLAGDRMLFPSDRTLHASMHGAYILWDDLLLALSLQQRKFLPALVDQMHATMNQPGSMYADEQNTEKEALQLWLLHVTTSEPWLRFRERATESINSQLIRRCCLHPGYWSYQVGKALLEKCSEDFVDLWSGLLEASAIAEVDNHGEVEDFPMNLGSTDGDGIHLNEQDGLSRGIVRTDAADVSAGWREALLPSSAPIGVVQ